jgi:hypothetical protein
VRGGRSNVNAEAKQPSNHSQRVLAILRYNH